MAGQEVPRLASASEGAGRVRQIAPGRYHNRGVLTDPVDWLATTPEPGREYAPTELQEVPDVQRKYLISLLEFLDRQ